MQTSLPVFALEELCIAAGSTVQIEATYHDNMIVLEYHWINVYRMPINAENVRLKGLAEFETSCTFDYYSFRFGFLSSILLYVP